MLIYNEKEKPNLSSIEIDNDWNYGEVEECKIHKVHSYPAKFPPFITTKAIDYAIRKGVNIQKIGDVFCGCGTVSYEANKNNIDFFGCDINPVAVMISKVKSTKYKQHTLQKYFTLILKAFYGTNKKMYYADANKRLQYWYDEETYNDLFFLKKSILENIPSKSSYKLFFLCAFSNILKPTSKWLSVSVKPQVDPNKKKVDVINAFKKQYKFMYQANFEAKFNATKSNIKTKSILSGTTNCENIDLLVTSPPYTTSYEYADLHQLSSLWLDYTSDYKSLRKGSIGSSFHIGHINQDDLNCVGKKIVSEVFKKDKNRIKGICKYFLDMQKATKKIHKMLSDNGVCVFVIGNTEIRGVIIDNTTHLSQSLLEAGFKNIEITKRKISNKYLTSYRDKNGRFTSDKNCKDTRLIYSEEFIVSCQKI